MKKITLEWLSYAADDIAALDLLLCDEQLTNIAAFHAQQAVEKSLKALLEELDLGLVKTHSLVRLNALIRPHYTIIEDLDMLDRLDAVYIEARYPGNLGLLPGGKPTLAEATRFGVFAREVYQKITGLIETDADYATAP